jgi:GNAT superfamily N-acetyltransferase
MSRVHVRRAEESDAEAIARVCATGWRDTYRDLEPPERVEAVIAEYYDPERIRREVEPRAGWDGWLVAVDGDEVVGAGGGGLIAPGVGEVFVLYLDPERRGEGIGTKLLAAITDQQREHGAREQWVSVVPGNEKGLPFYYARGFELRGERPEWGADPAEGRRALRLMRRLDAAG